MNASGEISYSTRRIAEMEIRRELAEFYQLDEIESWLTRPHPQLDGLPAIDAISQGRADEVFSIIQRLRDGVYL